ncbi:collagen-like triple helix repeat-containing protein [Ralstonia solanacearum]|uniref:collagen-like triple helix repeat-containing protein n=1 Tax=Ralstonia solanacearum TaxID=305 RepID=UPI0009BDC48D|nr:collagen-like triple helix repeat-containing protein [Ralstonia solanacearum]
MRAPAFLLRSSPPSRGVFLWCRWPARRMPGVLAMVSLAGIAGCATSGSGDMGASLGGSGSQSTSSLTASSSPTWSKDNGMTDSGSLAGNTMPADASITSVEQVNTAVVTDIVPLANALASATQTIGATTGLGAPVGSVLTTLGSALGSGGSTLTQAGKGNALTSALGGTVSALGTLTGSLATVMTPASPASGGSALSGALAPVTTVVGSLTAGLPGIGTPATTGNPLGGSGSAGMTLGGFASGVLSGVTPGAHR